MVALIILASASKSNKLLSPQAKIVSKNFSDFEKDLILPIS
jgi:hypothetical protein